MKKKIGLKKVVIVVAAVCSFVTGSIFMVLYANQYAEERGTTFTPSTYNSNVITPKSMGSYGELMFAYIGEDNYLYDLDDESSPLVYQPAAILLYASDDTVIYTAATEISEEHAGRESIIQELQIGENENVLNTIATVTIDPCWSSNDEVVYYVEDENKYQLCTFEPLTSTSEVAAEFEEAITGLRISSDGLLVTLETREELLYVPLSKQLTETYYNCQGSRLIVCEQYDLILSPNGALYYRWMGSNDAVKIADDVIVTQGYQDNEVFFIQTTSKGLSLNAYFVSEEKTVELASLPENILPQLTVSPDYAFVIDDNYVVYRYDIDTQAFGVFEIIPEDVMNPMISVFDYRLMVYDLAGESDATYVYSTDASKVITQEAVANINSYSETKNQSKNVEYSDYTTLQMASIGNDVYALQEKLISLGYMSSLPTGIYDVATTTAVQYLQGDLGMPESGVATGELQYLIFNTSVTSKSEYAVISTSSEGIRVRDLQARLRCLGYLKYQVSGKLDDNTVEAVKLFATQNGVDYSGGLIKSDIQSVLFSNIATEYHGYLDLQFNDSCDAVIQLNQRLKEMGYLTGAVNPTYDEKTADAITLFIEINGLQQVEGCNEELQSAIFDNQAVECPQNRAPEVVNDSESSTEGQVISDRQLKILRKWLTKQFAINHTDRQAVKRLQMQLVKLGYMDQSAVTMVYDQTTMDAVKAFQEENGISNDGIASKSTLTEIFNRTISNAIQDE